jgi:hypothetical protein
MKNNNNTTGAINTLTREAIPALLSLYDAAHPEDWVDASMTGSTISSAMALLRGAYGPATLRLLTAVAQEPGLVTKERMVELAPAAFAAAEDRDFAGNVITDFSTLLPEPYGFGLAIYRLSQLVPEVVRQQAAVKGARG